MSSHDSTAAGPDLFSVGEVAEATGISQATLRVWERRYGAPVPVRLASGHRRYTGEQLRWLRRLAEAMALGHRVSAIIGADEKELDQILVGPKDAAADPDVEAWMKMAMTFDGASLSAALRQASVRIPPGEFLERKIHPLLQRVGRGWSDGKVDIRHEHFVTQQVEDCLRVLRANLASPTGGGLRGLMLLATLPGELHGLGLQMAAVLCQGEGVAHRILGVDTPVEEIVRASTEINAEAVGISVSLSGGGVETDRRLVELRKQLPRSVALVCGGRGARRPRRGARGIVYLEKLSDFSRWLRTMTWSA